MSTCGRACLRLDFDPPCQSCGALRADNVPTYPIDARDIFGYMNLEWLLRWRGMVTR